MPIYKYIEKDNKNKTGYCIAKTKSECQLQLNLNSKGNVKIYEWLDLHGLEYILFGNISVSKLKKTIICDFFEQLAFLLRSGMSLYSGLEILGRTGEKDIKRICLKVIPTIVEGFSLDESLKRTGMFDPEVIHQVKAGIESGDLPSSLERISKTMRKQIKMKNKIITSSVYPLFMLVVLIAVTTFMMVSIIPQIANSFAELGGELPAITLFVIAASDWFVAYMPKIMIALAFFIFIFKVVILKNKDIKERVDYLFLKIPLFGDLSLKKEISSISNILSSLLLCGIPLVQSLSITSNTIKNEYLKRKIERTKKFVEIDGSSLYNALLQAKGFPILFMQLIDVGERSGDLVTVLNRLSERYDVYVENVLKRILTLMEPFVIVLMVAIGGVVVIGMMMPIFTIIDII